MENLLGAEIVVSSDSSEQKQNCVVWDPVTGSVLTAFRGGDSITGGLSLVGSDYLVSVVAGAPMMIVWHWRKGDSAERKIILPGVATALAITSSGHHCLVGISSKIYIWHIPTGNLLKVIDYHTHDIKCLKISKDERYIVSASAKETRVVVWSFLQVIDHRSQNDQPRPIYMFHDHSSFISDVYISTIGYDTKVVTCAADCSIFVYDLSTGRPIFSAFGETHFTKVMLDPCQFYMYLGTSDGDICIIEFHKHLNMESVKVSSDGLLRKWTKRHSKAITSLDLTPDSKSLLSGSEDCTAKIWNVSTGTNTCTHPHKGPVTNAFFSIATPQLTGTVVCQPSIPFQNLKKCIEYENLEKEMVAVKFSPIPAEPVQEPSLRLINSIHYRDFYTELLERQNVRQQLDDSRTINEQFYSFVLTTCLSNVLKDDINDTEN